MVCDGQKLDFFFLNLELALINFQIKSEYINYIKYNKIFYGG